MPGIPAFAGSDPSVAPPISCGNGVPGGSQLHPHQERSQRCPQRLRPGVKLQEHRRMEQAFAQFDEASRLAPRDILFLSARETTKAQLVFQHTERGDALLADTRPEQAAAEFRAALELDPDNDYAQQRLVEALRDPTHPTLTSIPALLADNAEIHLQPKAERATFHYRGDVRGLFTELASAFGVTPEFDDSVQTRRCVSTWTTWTSSPPSTWPAEVSKTMWTPLAAHQFLIAADNTENHKQFDRMSLASFTGPELPRRRKPPKWSPRCATCAISKDQFGTGWNRGSARSTGHAGGLYQAASAAEPASAPGRDRH